MNPIQPRKNKKSRTANSTYCTLKTLTNIIANVYAGSNRKGDMRKKWLILASCVRFRTSHHALARSVQLSPRRRAAASARSRLQGAYRCTHAGLRPPSRARAGQPTTRTGPNVRSPYLTTSYVASLSPQPLPEPVSEPMQQTCLPTASEEPSHVPASDASLPRALPVPPPPQHAGPLLRVVPPPSSMASE